MKDWKCYFWIFLIFGVLVTSTLVIKVQAGYVATGENRTIRVGLMPDIGMFPMLVAEEEGYFTKNNLKVPLTVFKSAKDRDAAFQGGQLDGMMSDLLATYFFQNNGLAAKAAIITESRFLLLAGKESGIKRIQDLQNVEIGLSLNTVIEYFSDTVLAGQQITAKKSSIPQVPVRMELLRSGKLKAAAMPDPLATVLTKAGAVVLADSARLQMDPAVLVFNGKVFRDQSGTLHDFIKVYNQAVDAINKNPEKYRHLLLEKGGFPAEVIKDIVIPHFRHATEPGAKEVAKIINWAREKGLEKRKLTYNDLVEKGFAH